MEQAILHYEYALKIQPKNREIQYIHQALSQKAGCQCDSAPPEYVQHLFDQYAKNYDKHLGFLQYQAPQQLYAAIIDVIKPSNKSLNIVDLGCGTGLCGEKFRHLANKLIGVDVSSKMLEVAKNKHIYDDLECNTIENFLNQCDNQDLILAADTLVYIGDLSLIFESCKKSLKNKGVFAFTVEQSENLPFVLQQNGRFAHHQKYINELALKNSFNAIVNIQINIRKHREKHVKSLLYVLQKIIKPTT